jgi:hypothetical protein
MADAVHIHGDAHDQFEGSGELLDLHWVPLSDAKRLDLPPITSLVIDEISKQLAAGSRAAAMSVPFIQFPRGKVLIRGI